MADPIVTPATAASYAAATPIVAFTATVCGVSVAVIVAAVIGAGLAAINAEKVEWTTKGILAGLAVFLMAMALGIFLGPLVVFIAEPHVAKLAGRPLPAGALDWPVSFLVALLGQRHILPAIEKLLPGWITTKGSPQP